jgi:hypothetical protein
MRNKRVVLACCTLLVLVGVRAGHSTQSQTANQRNAVIVLQPPKVVFHFSEELASKLKTENPGFELWPTERTAMTEEGLSAAKLSSMMGLKRNSEKKCFVCDEWECKDNGPPTRTVCCQCKRGHWEDCK